MEGQRQKLSLASIVMLADGAMSGERKRSVIFFYNSLLHDRSHNFSPSAWGTLSRAKGKRKSARREKNSPSDLDGENSEDEHAASINVCVSSVLC